jgi:CHAT domain-containing protein
MTGFDYLQNTLKEADSVSAKLVKTNIRVKEFKGQSALEESFKALSGPGSPSVIHIATHGFYYPYPQDQQRREQAIMAGAGEMKYSYSEDPLLRSGLIMAGANRAWIGKPVPPGVEDGILTAREVSEMDLRHTQLVVLSACQTGLGDVKGSEGVEGLQRAFKMAGVRYLIISLWEVPDKETVEFMDAFYSQWLGGKEIREAFRTAQQYMYLRYPNEPDKWAAFVLTE